MNEKELLIKQKLRTEAEKFFTSIKDEGVRQLFEEYSFIAGGAIASLILNEEPKDYDFYFKDITACQQAVDYFLKEMNASYEVKDIIRKDDGVSLFVEHGIIKRERNGEKYQPVVLTANAFSFTDKVQFVIRFAADVNEIVKSFDFVHSKAIYDYKEDSLIVPEETLSAINRKQLVFTGSEYPLASLIRTRKFISRGWNLNAGQYLKIALQINALDLYNLEVLREQLIGVDLLHFADFLEKLEKMGMSNIEYDTQSNNLFVLIDQAFESNVSDLSDEEWPF